MEAIQKLFEILWDNLAGAVFTAITGLIVILYQNKTQNEIYKMKREMDEKFDKSFYGFQKQLDEIYAKSMLEYQTKFLRSHEKTAETLENIYQLHSTLRNILNPNLLRYKMLLTSDNLPLKAHDEILNCIKKANDLREYFYDNLIYVFDNEMRRKIQDIVIFDGDVLAIVGLFHNKKIIELDLDTINFLISSINQSTSINIGNVERTKESVLSLVVEIENQMNSQLMILDEMYKLVTAVK